MKKLALLTTSLVVTSPIAFDPGKVGWKKDADGNIETDTAGNPIYIGGDGKEQTVKQDTIANLQQEAKAHRVAKETAEANLAKFGKIKPEDAIANAATLKDIDLTKMVNKDQLDEVRREVGAEYQTKIDEANATNAELQKGKDQMQLDNMFSTSKFFKDNVAIPLDMFAGRFSSSFKVEDGQVVGYHANGNKLSSLKSPGEIAGFDEALEMLVDQYPHKDSILKAEDQRGSGNQGDGGNGDVKGAKMTRSTFDQLSPAEQADVGTKAAKGELTIV